MEKAKRRDTYTAILFLAGLIFVLGYLFAGLMPKMGGFAAVSKPGHRSYAETQTLRGGKPFGPEPPRHAEPSGGASSRPVRPAR